MLQRHTQAAPRAYDVIVVLGAAVWPGGQPSPALQCRVLHAVDLLQRGYALHLLVTGGVGQYPPAEAEVMTFAVSQGGSLTLTLRRPDDHDLVDIPKMNWDNFGSHSERTAR